MRMLKAVTKHREEEVERLVRAGVEVNTRDRHGETALHKAAADRDPTMVNMLPDLGGDVHLTVRVGFYLGW